MADLSVSDSTSQVDYPSLVAAAPKLLRALLDLLEEVNSTCAWQAMDDAVITNAADAIAFAKNE